MRLGHLAFVLHAHLPFVRHPEHPEFLEEDWLFEALTETYLPLIQMLEDLERDRVDWHLTMSVTPTLAAMLSDPLLQDRYQTRLKRLVELAGKELERTRWEPEFHHVARMYLERFTQCQALYERLGRNPIAGLKKLKKAAGSNSLVAQPPMVTCRCFPRVARLRWPRWKLVAASLNVILDFVLKVCGFPNVVTPLVRTRFCRNVASITFCRYARYFAG